MSVLFMESFDKYTLGAGGEAEMQEYGWITAGGGDIDISAGRNGNAAELTSFDAIMTTPTLAPNSNEGWVGFAYKTDTVDNDIFLRIREGTTTHLYLKSESDGTITIHQGDGTLLGTSTFAQVANTFFYLEFHWIIDNSAGAFGIRFNGQASDDDADTGIDTQNGGTAAWDNVRFLGQASSSPDDFYDDIYVLDDVDSGIAGAPNNDYLGDMIVEAIEVDGAGNTTELTPSTGANFENVDDTPGHDGDGTHNESATVGLQDTYTLANLVLITNDDIKAIQVCAVMKKPSAGTRSGRAIIRHGGTDYYGATVVLGTSYVYSRDIAEGANPFGGTTQWTIANVNALEAGFDVVA